MTKTTDTRPFASDGQRLTPGAYLKSIREKKRISRAYLQQQLGLTNTLFDALEADECERLPSPIYVRGYLRRYAELTGERVAPILAGYQALLEARGLVAPPEPEEPPPQRPYLAMVGSALGMLLATSLVFGAILSDPAEYPEEQASAAADAAAREVAPAAPTQTDPAAPGDNLDLTFTTDSWVEVVDARDHILAVSLQREGTRLQLEGKPPFTVTLGYGPGVAVSYLGERVEFEHDPETFSSKFVVGR